MSTLRTTVRAEVLTPEGYSGTLLASSTNDATVTSPKTETYTLATPIGTIVKSVPFNVHGFSWKSDVGIQLAFTKVAGASISWGGRLSGAPTGDVAHAKQALVVLDDPILASEFTTMTLYCTAVGTVTLTLWGA